MNIPWGFQQRLRQAGFLALAICLALGFAAERANGEIYEAKGRRIKVKLALEQADMMVGEPAYLSFTIFNDSRDSLEIERQPGDNVLGRDPDFHVTLSGQDGKPVPQPEPGPLYDGAPEPGELPPGGSYIFHLLVLDWANLTASGRYTVQARRKLTLIQARKGEEVKMTTLIVRARAVIQVVPVDAERMGRVVDSLGQEMLRPPFDWRTASAVNVLGRVNDPRAVPYLARAASSGDYELQWHALIALGRYNDATAFRALKHGLAIKPEDERETTVSAANWDVHELRETAADSLIESPYPESFPYIFAHRQAIGEGVRQDILLQAGKMRAAEAIPIFRKMTHDPSESIRKRAVEQLRLFLPDPPAPTSVPPARSQQGSSL